ncbi:2-dehydro-3-deoxygalactonokinase [Porticoccaceae bacterium]|nr:2-dehydro-3-deoxygalactonokinase [Porticoccaceae bacterium]MDB9737193.1 2-dehydro-3-deoxygalactonokinase [Porticoccaceae bacterium]MDB9992781.1 2-dehydro-3-deoxygalactonokinase [Porticoccaceae bacterium]
MTEALFIAGDWGTTHLRLYLCQHNSSQALNIVATQMGPGVSQVQGDFEQIFFDLAGQWFEDHGPMPVILSGMVGSNIGWHAAPYIDCPASAEQIVAGRTGFQARGIDFSIISGLRTTNPLGTPDLMRGEELQLLGWMGAAAGPANKSTSAELIVLPGTHNKWALVRGGKIETFVTALTGELYSLLQNHSVLIANGESADFSDDIFLQGVKVATTLESGQLLQALFATRSRQILGELSESYASSYLSGLLIGSDVVGSVALMEKQMGRISSVELIGESALSRCYQLALESVDIKAELRDATQISISGYQAVYEAVYEATQS